MATVNQLVRKPRARKVAKATCLRWKHARKNVAYVLVYTTTPKRTPRCVKYAVFV